MKPYYEGNGATLYHGSCEEVLPQLSGVALTVTSPPYNIGITQLGGQGLRSSVEGYVRKAAGGGYDDSMPEAEYVEWLGKVAAAIHGATAPDGSMFFNHKVRYADRTMLHPLDLVRTFAGWTVVQEIVWSRPGAPFPTQVRFGQSDERIYWLAANGRRGYKVSGKRVGRWTTVWEVNRAQGRWHPASFPGEIPYRAILAATERKDLVLDPFAGAGTTLTVALALHRRAVGIEQREDYCEKIATALATA